MADRANVVTAPDKHGRGGEPTPFTVKLRESKKTFPAVLLANTVYVPNQGDDVTTLPLSDGQALVLGFFS